MTIQSMPIIYRIGVGRSRICSSHECCFATWNTFFVLSMRSLFVIKNGNSILNSQIIDKSVIFSNIIHLSVSVHGEMHLHEMELDEVLDIHQHCHHDEGRSVLQFLRPDFHDILILHPVLLGIHLRCHHDEEQNILHLKKNHLGILHDLRHLHESVHHIIQNFVVH